MARPGNVGWAGSDTSFRVFPQIPISRQPQLTSWNAELSARFPGLSAPVIIVLAVYSIGMILAAASGLTTVVFFLVRHLGWQCLAVRKRQT